MISKSNPAATPSLMLNETKPGGGESFSTAGLQLATPMKGRGKRQKTGALYQRIATILRTRILYGDYSLKALPSERKLAAEFSINFMTVRRSLRELEAEGLLVRQPNGRLVVGGNSPDCKRIANLAMLLPVDVSSMMEGCRRALLKAADGFPCTIRPVLFSHWDDPALLDSVKSFDGIFLYPFEDEPPTPVVNHLLASKNPVVVLDHDFSRYGIPSIQFFPPAFAQRLLDHLEEQGHRSIGCLNTQSPNAETFARINQWKLWMAAHDFEGRLVDEPVDLHGSAAHHAHTVMRRLLEKDRGRETAWFCVTMPAATGAMRAMSDLGIRPGEDLALCAVNGEGLADLLVPSVTALEQHDFQTFLKYSLKWMLSGQPTWQGPLLMQSNDAALVVRASTQKKFTA